MAPSRLPQHLSRRSFLKSTVVTGVGLSAAAASYGYFLERYRVLLTKVTMPVVGLPPAFEGFRIGFLTDLHVSSSVPPVIVSTAVELLMAGRPDLVALGGDYISWFDTQYADAAAELLRPLSAPHGVVAVLGNHDDEHLMIRLLEARGINVLYDDATALTIGSDTLSIVGIRYWTKQLDHLEEICGKAKGTRVLLAHDPRRLREARTLGVSSVISGHTHGGQIVIPGVGALAARRYPVAAGLAQDGDTTLFVSRGIGTVYLPWRFNCPPEVAEITLTAANAS